MAGGLEPSGEAAWPVRKRGYMASPEPLNPKNPKACTP